MGPQVIFTPKSENEKTGPMAVSITESTTCPPNCKLRRASEGGTNICYSLHGPMRFTWNRLDRHECGMPWADFCNKVKALPAGAYWRHNVSGDLPGVGDTIDAAALAMLVKANAGKRGFTYTHKPLTVRNFDLIRAATASGFTINASMDTLVEADYYRMVDETFPMAVMLPIAYGKDEAPKTLKTPKGRVVMVCPAVRVKGKTCLTCGLCYKADRKAIIGFPAHGVARKRADKHSQGFAEIAKKP
jgi:hypothetical protein